MDGVREIVVHLGVIFEPDGFLATIKKVENDVGLGHRIGAIVLRVSEEFDVVVPLVDHILHRADDVGIFPAVFLGHIIVIVKEAALPPLGFDLIDFAARMYTAEKSGVRSAGGDHRDVRVNVLADCPYVGQVFEKDVFYVTHVIGILLFDICGCVHRDLLDLPVEVFHLVIGGHLVLAELQVLFGRLQCHQELGVPNGGSQFDKDIAVAVVALQKAGLFIDSGDNVCCTVGLVCHMSFFLILIIYKRSHPNLNRWLPKIFYRRLAITVPAILSTNAEYCMDDTVTSGEWHLTKLILSASRSLYISLCTFTAPSSS